MGSLGSGTLDGLGDVVDSVLERMLAADLATWKDEVDASSGVQAVKIMQLRRAAYLDGLGDVRHVD